MSLDALDICDQNRTTLLSSFSDSEDSSSDSDANSAN